MDGRKGNGENAVYDRALLLHGAKRNEVLTLEEVQQYGIDSFADAEYIRIYGMSPAEWYGRGIRLLGRTAVECTRDALADLIGRDVAALAARMPSTSAFVVIDPFAGSCNTLYWILRHLAKAEGIAFELDPHVYALSNRNIAALDQKIELVHGDYQTLLQNRRVPADRGVIVFVAPPWGTALDERVGLDLRRTTPPISEVVSRIARTVATQPLLFATQVYEKINPVSLADLRALVDWSELRIYRLNDEGRNHGILLATRRWMP
jgi:RNA cap guanine-N2 methyltransferase